MIGFPLRKKEGRKEGENLYATAYHPPGEDKNFKFKLTDIVTESLSERVSVRDSQ